VREGGDGVHGFRAVDGYDEDVRAGVVEDEGIGGGRLGFQGGSHCGDEFNVSSVDVVGDEVER